MLARSHVDNPDFLCSISRLDPTIRRALLKKIRDEYSESAVSQKSAVQELEKESETACTMAGLCFLNSPYANQGDAVYENYYSEAETLIGSNQQNTQLILAIIGTLYLDSAQLTNKMIQEAHFSIDSLEIAAKKYDALIRIFDENSTEVATTCYREAKQSYNQALTSSTKLVTAEARLFSKKQRITKLVTENNQHLNNQLESMTPINVVNALLADSRTDPNQATTDGETPLFIAAENGHN